VSFFIFRFTTRQHRGTSGTKEKEEENIKMRSVQAGALI